MWPLTDSDFLRIWESGFRKHPLDRALLALAEASDTPVESLAEWPLGRRNAALVELHRQSFGNSLPYWIACRRCGEKLESKVDGSALTGDEALTSDDPIIVNRRAFRVPSSRNLAGAATTDDSALGAIRLLENCLLDVVRPQGWSAQDLEDIGERMAQADPLAEIRLSLRCPSCGEEWEETLDIASYVWEEIEAQARKLLFEVHSLTLAYGWTEADILSLSDGRRAAYLSMVQA